MLVKKIVDGGGAIGVDLLWFGSMPVDTTSLAVCCRLCAVLAWFHDCALHWVAGTVNRKGTVVAGGACCCTQCMVCEVYICIVEVRM